MAVADPNTSFANHERQAMKTYSAKPDDIRRDWYVIDGTDQVAAIDVAKLRTWVNASSAARRSLITYITFKRTDGLPITRYPVVRRLFSI